MTPHKNAKLTMEVVEYLRNNEVVDLLSIAEEYGVTVKHLKKIRTKNYNGGWKTASYSLCERCVKKTNLTKEEIREIRSSPMTLSQLADWYGISTSFASDIRRRKKYKGVK